MYLKGERFAGTEISLCCESCEKNRSGKMSSQVNPCQNSSSPRPPPEMGKQGWAPLARARPRKPSVPTPTETTPALPTAWHGYATAAVILVPGYYS